MGRVMHYYQHHIGDFIKDTSFLTNDEIGIYLKLIWLYYDTEKPLPNNLFELSMKTGTRDNQVVLEGLLEMFFVLHEDDQCWHHSRCDKEIEHYKQQLTTASKAGKASALKRALNKNLTVVEQALNRGSTEVQPTNNQQPLTNNQVKKALGKRLATDFSFPLEWEQFCKETRPELHPTKTFDQFKDYWIAQAGQKGVKLDWFATWRNWVRSTNAPKTNFADIARVTVPSSNLPDPTLEKIKSDRMKAVPPSLEVLAKMAQLRGKA
jgi:uncharacterized protein YdaU (DUF1376 family)